MKPLQKNKMTIHEAISFINKELKPLYHHDEGAAIAQWILSWVTCLNAAQLITHRNTSLTQHQIDTLNTALLEHVKEHKPIQYIFGSIPFLGLDIRIYPPILIPRPETEYWCSILIDHLSPLSNQHITILDMCTGSGCIALALAKAFPKATVFAADISKTAYDLAQENALKNNVPIKVIESDLFNQLPTKLTFDLIVSNPPYISPEEWRNLDPSVREWEDPQALLAQDHGLALLKEIINTAPSWLKENKEMQSKHIPQLVVEIGYEQGKLVETIFSKAGFRSIQIHQDLAGLDRFVTGEFYGASASAKSRRSLY